MLVGIGSRSGVSVRDRIINLPPGDLDGGGGHVFLAEALVVRKPSGVRDPGVGLL